MDQEQLNSLLSTAGIAYSADGGIDWSNLIAGLIFGTIGTVVLIYGWKNKSVKPIGFGLVLSIYPFFVKNTIMSYVIGIALCAGLYYWRD